MSEPAPVRIATGRFTIEGSSRAGNETYFRVRELGLALDIGRCPAMLVGISHVFVTHAHLDHALGIPFYAAQRTLQSLPAGSVYVPAESAGGFDQLMRLHEQLESTTYDLNLIGLAVGDRVAIRRDLLVEAHRASHRVPANAYEILESRHKLKEQYRGLSENELVGLRKSGSEIMDQSLHSILFYTGDTDRILLEENARLFQSEVLMIECSFVGEDRERAARYRHIHIEDVYDFAGRFANHLIVLTHFSLRYSPAEIHRTISARCPAVLRERIRLALPEPFVAL